MNPGLVIIESPYAGDVEANRAYAIAAMRDSLERGESPLVFHLLYTQALDDSNESDREWGIRASFTWYGCATVVAVYDDLGISSGMKRGICEAARRGIEIEFRSLKGTSDASV